MTFYNLICEYHIYSVIGQGFPFLECLPVTKSVLCNLAVIRVLPFLTNPKDLDLSYRMDLDFYTPSIYAEGYVAFTFPFMFICSLVCLFVHSFFTFRHVRRIYLKVFN